MSKSGYYQIRLTDENETQVRAICQRMGINPDEWGAYSKAINFALRLVAMELVKDEQ